MMTDSILFNQGGFDMNVNGVSGYSQLDAYNAYASNSKAEKTKEEKADAVGSDVAAVYEKSDAAASDAVYSAKTYKTDADLVKKLMADADAAKNQLMSYVQETLMGQGNAVAASDDVWKFLASGNYTVSAAAKEEAQKAISEGGYWSVEKTSDRIIEFAKALTGGNPDMIDKMRHAFEKGFKEATKAWGRDLPDISKNTYDAVMKKFDNWSNEAKKSSEEESAEAVASTI